MRLASILGSNSFAHLVGRSVVAKAKAADESNETEDEKKKREDEEAAKANRAEGDEVVDGETEDEKKKREDEEAAKAKRAKRADADDGGDEDDDDAEMRGKSAAASARLRERARCAAIFSSPAAAGNPALAANLAFNTALPRKEALAVLENSAPAATARSPGEGRAARNPRLGVPGGASAEGPMTAAQEAAANASKILATARAAGAKF